jgi:diadenosine tetraphosphatase ApaH/serine/threonine PP2A family protein phosphatase
MRFAAIADIHGNCLALDAVLADIAAQGIAAGDVVNLGDSLSGPLEAGRTADRLVGLGLTTVCGNHDRYLIEHATGDMHSWEADAYAQLSPDHLDWLKRLPFSQVWREEVYLCHATPTSDSVYWLEGVSEQGHVHLRPKAEIEAFAENVRQPMILCGHSHIPRAVRLADGRLIVNPGSVGGPGYDDDAPYFHKVETGTPLASYAILEKTPAGWSVTFRLVPYDNMAMSRLAAERGRADWSAALAGGWLD